ncbi:serine protease [Pseudomonas sp. RIT623]|uniref:S1 family peptidase n=1 Tax=Pseudomonas sp. RIT623 TaxID=2559075 RepID=UPI00106FB2C0|nr:serine protease [Pseudomonas sp. RIT623]TFF41275.1 serine protease [Pseudomonas sp. RIT623]
MCVARYFSSPLRSLLTAAMLGMTPGVSVASEPLDHGIDTSAMGLYQRTVGSDGAFGLRQVTQGTAFLFDSGSDAAPALLVTSGHALHDDGDFVGAQLAGVGQISFGSVPGRYFQVAHVRYLSRRGLDFAILELPQTQGELKALGLTPMTLAGRKALDSEVVIATTRLSGSQNGVASWPVQDLPWINMQTGEGVLYRHLLRVEGASLRDGDSGSPVVDASHAVVAVLHTDLEGAAHAADLSFLPACLIQGRFNAQAPGCGLGNTFNAIVEKDEDNRLIYKQSDHRPIVIDPSVYATTSFYQAKLAQWPEQCEGSEGYGPVRASGEALNLSVAGFILAPANPTVLALCVWGRATDGPEPANRNALAVPVLVHPPGPAAQPELKVSAPYLDFYGRRAYRVSVPSRHILFQRVEFKLGPWRRTDCANPLHYGDLPGTGTGKIIIRQDSRLCAVGIDHAGQRSVAVEARLQP